MMALLGLGTYRCRDLTTSARAAIASGASLIDTAPVYAQGTAHLELAGLLAEHPGVRISTKAGHMTPRQSEAAQQAGVITAEEATRCHSITPTYLEHRIATSSAELGRECLDLLYLHNPEHGPHGDRDQFHEEIVQAFTACEQAAYEGRIAGYGVATWSGFSSGAFTVQDLLSAAYEAAGTVETNLKAIQLPVSLLQIGPLSEALRGVGPVSAATDAGLEVWASAPLGGGELATLVTTELADYIVPGSSRVAAALAAVASTPGLTGVLLSASSAAHWHEAYAAFQQPPISRTHLQEVCRVLRA